MLRQLLVGAAESGCNIVIHALVMGKRSSDRTGLTA